MSGKFQEFLPFLYGFIGALTVWLANKLWSLGENSHKKLIEATQGLTLAMVELKVEIKNIKESFVMQRADTEKLKQDMHGFHSAVRELKNQISK